jgi:hypothetical protein
MAAARALLLALFFTLAPGVAAAQLTGAVPQPPVVPPHTPPPSTIPSGPDIALPIEPSPGLRPTQTFTIRPSIAFTEQYTDNFNLSEHGKIANLRSVVAPGFSILLDRGFLTGHGGYNLSITHDTSQDEIGYFNSFVGGLSWATSRLRINAAYVFSQTDEPDRADRLNLRQERREFIINNFSVDAAYGLGAFELRPHYRLSHFTERDSTTISHTVGMDGSVAVDKIHRLTAGYVHLRSDTDRERTSTGSSGGESSNLTGHELSGSLSRDLTPRSTAGISAAYAARQQTNFEGKSDFSRWNISIFNNYTLPLRLVLRGNIGVSQLNGDESSGRPLLTTSSSVSYWFGPAVAVLLFEQGLAETFGAGDNFGVVETSAISASLRYPFTPLVHGSLIVSYRENKFTGEGDGTDIDGTARAGREETTLGGTASLTVQLLRWLGSSLDYTYTDVSSSDGTRRYTENRVTVRFIAEF